MQALHQQPPLPPGPAPPLPQAAPPPPPLYLQRPPPPTFYEQPAAAGMQQQQQPGFDPQLQQQQQQQYYDGQPPPPQQQQQFEQQQPHAPPTGKKRGKRGKRGSGLEARQRAFKQRGVPSGNPQELGFFGAVPMQQPSLQQMRRENLRRAQQHFAAGGAGGGGRAQQLQQQQQPSAGVQQKPGGRPRRARGGKSSKHRTVPPQPTPHTFPQTPAGGNPLDTPAIGGKEAAEPGGADRLEAEGLQAGLDWFGTNESSAALFLAGHQLTTSDSEGDDDGLDDLSGSDGEAPSGGGAASGGADAAPGEQQPGGYEDAALPRSVQARLVEQEAYIAELEDQNLRLREQLEMLEQEVAELRGHRAPADSEEGFAEHSEGSLPGDHSVMHHHSR